MAGYNFSPEVVDRVFALSLKTSCGDTNPKDGARFSMTSEAHEYCVRVLYPLLGGKAVIQQRVREYLDVEPQADPDCANWVWSVAITMVLTQSD